MKFEAKPITNTSTRPRQSVRIRSSFSRVRYHFTSFTWVCFLGDVACSRLYYVKPFKGYFFSFPLSSSKHHQAHCKGLHPYVIQYLKFAQSDPSALEIGQQIEPRVSVSLSKRKNTKYNMFILKKKTTCR